MPHKTLLLAATWASYVASFPNPDFIPAAYDEHRPETANYASVEATVEAVVKRDHRKPGRVYAPIFEGEAPDETILDAGPLGTHDNDRALACEGMVESPLPPREGVRDELVPRREVRPLGPEGDAVAPPLSKEDWDYIRSSDPVYSRRDFDALFEPLYSRPKGTEE